MDDQERLVSPLVMTMPDEIDVSNAGYVGEQLRSAITPGTNAVVADLTATTFCDSFAVLHLMLAHDKAVANNVQLLLVVPAGAVLRLLETGRRSPRAADLCHGDRCAGCSDRRPRPR